MYTIFSLDDKKVYIEDERFSNTFSCHYDDRDIHRNGPTTMKTSGGCTVLNEIKRFLTNTKLYYVVGGRRPYFISKTTLIDVEKR